MFQNTTTALTKPEAVTHGNPMLLLCEHFEPLSGRTELETTWQPLPQRLSEPGENEILQTEPALQFEPHCHTMLWHHKQCYKTHMFSKINRRRTPKLTWLPKIRPISGISSREHPVWITTVLVRKKVCKNMDVYKKS